MPDLFLHLFNISISASYMIVAVILIRLLLKKAPRKYTCILWGLVGLRLAIPVKIESIFSLLPSGETVSPQIFSGDIPVEKAIDTGIQPLNNVINSSVESYLAPVAEYGKSPLEIFIYIVSVIWLAVAAAIILLGVISFIKFKLKLRFAVLEDNGCYKSDRITSPFIFGIISPKIYLPFNMDKNDADYIIAHEKAHIKRLDHLTKILAFILLAVYWFNLPVWVAYLLLQKDIEISCDQSVVKKMVSEEKQNYSMTLLKYSMSPKMRAITPLAFGEISVKQRIKQIMSYKKPTLWVTIIAIVLSIVIALCFLTLPEQKNNVTTPLTNETSSQTNQNNTSDKGPVVPTASQVNKETASAQTDNYRLYVHKTDYDKIFEITDNNFRMQYDAEFELQGIGAVDVIVKGQRMDMITAITEKKITVKNIRDQAENDLKAGVCRGQYVSFSLEILTAYVYKDYVLIFEDLEYLSGDPHTAYTNIRITHIDIFNSFLSHLIYVDEKETTGKKVSDQAFEDKYGYEIRYNNTSTADIYIGGKRIDLWQAIKSGKITVDELLERAKEDSANRFISTSAYTDGGTKIYNYPGYTITKYNTMPSTVNHALHTEDYSDRYYRDLVISKR